MKSFKRNGELWLWTSSFDAEERLYYVCCSYKESEKLICHVSLVFVINENKCNLLNVYESIETMWETTNHVKRIT